MTEDDIKIKINTSDLEITELVVKQDRDIPEEGLIQFTLKNTSKKNYMINSLKLKLYGKDRKYLGHDWSVEEDEILHKEDEKSLEFDIEDWKKTKSAEIKVKGTAYVDGSFVFKVILGLIFFIFLVGLISFW